MFLKLFLNIFVGGSVILLMETTSNREYCCHEGLQPSLGRCYINIYMKRQDPMFPRRSLLRASHCISWLTFPQYSISWCHLLDGMSLYLLSSTPSSHHVVRLILFHHLWQRWWRVLSKALFHNLPSVNPRHARKNKSTIFSLFWDQKG